MTNWPFVYASRNIAVMPKVIYVQQDLAKGQADFVVFPCSTKGTFSEYFNKKVIAYDLMWGPFHGRLYDSNMGLGEIRQAFYRQPVRVMESKKVIFACSVDEHTSNTYAIEKIGLNLGLQARLEKKENLVFKAPLLGSGSGELSAYEAAQALTSGFMSNAPDSSTLEIRLISKDHIKEIQYWGMDIENRGPVSNSAPIKVFISYTKHGASDLNQISTLHNWLRKKNVDSFYDKKTMHRGKKDIANYMQDSVMNSDRVLIIASPQYKERSHDLTTGVGKEVSFIKERLLDERFAGKFVIVYTEAVHDCIPEAFINIYALRYPQNEREMNLLVDALRSIPYNQDSTSASPPPSPQAESEAAASSGSPT